jgi:hypothetical protein
VDPTLLKDTLADSILADAPIKFLDGKIAAAVAANNNQEAGKYRAVRTQRVAQIENVFDKWTALGKQKGGREAMLKMRQFFKDMLVALRAQNFSAIKNMGLSQASTQDLQALVDKALEGGDSDSVVPNNLYPREYMPSKRFGEYWVDMKGDVTAKRERVFAVYATAGERDAATKRLAEEYGLNAKDGDIFDKGNSLTSLQAKTDIRGTLLDQMFKGIDAAIAASSASVPDLKEIEAVKEQLFRTWLMSAPSDSLRKNFIQTEDLVAGFDKDILRVFNNSANQYASHLAAVGYRSKIEKEIQRARDQLVGMPPDAKARNRMFIDETESRLETDYDAASGKGFFNDINRALFFYFLTAPATAAAQWVSLPQVVMPVLGASYGYAKTNLKFTKYMNLTQSLGITDTNGDKNWLRMSMERSSVLRKNPVLMRAYRAAQDRAVFETSVDMMTASATTPNTGSSKWTAQAAQNTAKAMSAIYTASETMTREIAYMTAFELHYDKTKDFDASVDAAVRNVTKSMGSYLDIERPKILRNPAFRSLFAFKMYALNMTRFYMTNVATMASFDGTVSKGERVVAMKEMAGVTVMGALLAGVPGTMVFGIVGAAAGLVMKAVTDDEEKKRIREENPLINPLDNFEAWFRQVWLPEMYGDDMANFIENGAVSQLTGADFASRLSNSNMWFRDGSSGGAAGADDQQIWEFAKANIPPISMGAALYNAYGEFMDGKFLRASAKVAPAILRGPLNAIRMDKEGVESPSTGDTVIERDELTPMEIVVQALGFRPMYVSDLQRELFAYRGADRQAEASKAKVLSALYMSANDEQGTEANVARAKRMLERHNERYPDPPYFIASENIRNSERSRRSADARTTRGVELDRGEEDLFRESVSRGRQ